MCNTSLHTNPFSVLLVSGGPAASSVRSRHRDWESQMPSWCVDGWLHDIAIALRIRLQSTSNATQHACHATNTWQDTSWSCSSHCTDSRACCRAVAAVGHRSVPSRAAAQGAGVLVSSWLLWRFTVGLVHRRQPIRCVVHMRHAANWPYSCPTNLL